MQALRLRVGCEFVHIAEADTAAVLQVEVRDTPPISVLRHAWSGDPHPRIRHYTDLYGDACARLVVDGGGRERLRLRDVP